MDKIKEKYADLFPSETGNVAAASVARCACLIQRNTGIPMWKLFCVIQVNPYLQYSVGMRAMTTATAPLRCVLYGAFPKTPDA